MPLKSVILFLYIYQALLYEKIVSKERKYSVIFTVKFMKKEVDSDLKNPQFSKSFSVL